MIRPAIDLSRYMTQDVPQDPAAFPIELRPLYYKGSAALEEVPQRLAMVRTDTGKAIAVVSEWSKIVTHQSLLRAYHTAAQGLDAGPMQRATYVDRGGARMRALIAFPGLAESVRERDMVCPCIVVQNTYNRSGRILIHVGAFRFICSNLALGGGGLFASGYMRIPAGEIPVDQLGQQLEHCLNAFWNIVRAYRIWAERPLDRQGMDYVLEGLPAAVKARIWRRINNEGACTVFDAYQAATHLGTHGMPSLHRAFDLLEHINAGFQRVFRSR
jgi:hypothetical protein